jgi:hypothetical protein
VREEQIEAEGGRLDGEGGEICYLIPATPSESRQNMNCPVLIIGKDTSTSK